jgi:hypothetical protein
MQSMCTYIYAYICSIQYYIFLRDIRPIHVDRLRKPYTHIYIFHDHIPIHLYVFLRPYTYTCLHTFTPVFTYGWSLLRPYVPTPCILASDTFSDTCLHIRPYTHAYLHTSTLMCLFRFTNFYPHLPIYFYILVPISLYMFTHFYAHIRPVYDYTNLRSYTTHTC